MSNSKEPKPLETLHFKEDFFKRFGWPKRTNDPDASRQKTIHLSTVRCAHPILGLTHDKVAIMHYSPQRAQQAVFKFDMIDLRPATL
ncbi:hypothetical protein GOBAR_AA33988 [Gossypium barbadense]|uniref:Uncharacterized protein n=1 Tax=Gossypium barbadense TaxID=3634 RepID=A0A2P5W6K0_GOSBA|nr:hypothetical protein GOBAR_AA33988 [Gossypium barbadense]